MMFNGRLVRVAAILALVGLAGCPDGQERCYPVRGTVVYEDGTPAKSLAGGSVTLTPEKGSPIASSTIADDGSFVLSTRKKSDGAIAGKHRAEIEVPDTGDSDGPARKPPLKSLIDLTTAVQQVTVEPQDNVITLKVKKATPRR